MKVPRSLKQLTAPFRELDPKESVDLTRKQLDEFAMQIAAKGYCHLAVPYGKAYFLFNSMIQYLGSYNFTACLLKSLSYPDRLILRNLARNKRENEIAILVDSIREGREVKKLHDQLEGHDVRVKWIFSYLTNSKGLWQLKSEGFPVKKIVSYKIVDPSEYPSEYGKILVYLQSRIEPLVEGAPFDVYFTQAGMKEEEFLDVVSEDFSSALHCNDFKVNPDRWLHATSGIHSYSYECHKINDCHSNDSAYADVPNIKELDFETAKYGIKVDCRESGITFRVAVLTPPNCNIDRIVPSDPRKCPYKPIIEKMPAECQVSGFPPNKRPLVRDHFCPKCIGIVVSVRVLDLVKKEVQSSLQKKNVAFTTRRYIPM